MNDVTPTKNLSSELGRQWLSNLSDQHVLRFRSAENSTACHENPTSSKPDDYPMISIPHFDASNDDYGSFNSARTEMSRGGTATLSETQTTRSVRPTGFKAPHSDLTEDPDEWQEETQTDEPSRHQTVPDSNNSDGAIDVLVSSILDRFPLAGPTLLLFVASDSNPHVDSTCAAVAETLAECNIGNVLLIDSNSDGSMTQRRGLEQSPGVSDLIESDTQWRSLVANEMAAGLDFLPAGSQDWNCWGGEQRLRNVAAEMKREYQFICVSAGDAHLCNAKLWSGVCDGSYLLVSLTNSNQFIAESAVTELQSSGARLLGCVVTDAA